MPVIEMPKKEEPAHASQEGAEPTPVRSEAEDLLPERAEPSDKEIIEKIQSDLMKSLSTGAEDDEPLVEVTERNIPNEDEVFNDPPERVKVEQPTPLEEHDSSAQPTEFDPAPRTKRKYVRKKPMTDKQRDHLARIRQIANEKRKQKKLEAEQLKKEKEEQKEKEKEEARIKKAEERILKKQREEQEQINRVNNQNNQNNIKAPQPQTGFTREDMEKAMFSAISSYETIRKAEKAEKKKRELAEARERQMTRTLQQAIQPNKPPDQWRQFFS